MLDSRFDIDARVPAGTTHDQFYQMLQNMLIERFGLKFHLDKTEVPGYELVVGKSGLKLKESTVPPQSVNILLSPTFDRAGYPVYPPDAQGTGGRDNHRGGHWPSITMQRFARILSQTLSSPVVDATGLSATYEVSLRWVPNPDLPDAAGPSIFAALQDQLGLKLNGKKTTVPKVVVDHAEKVPTEN
jgi:uncharacterized protein (TIGR03435 family)